MLKPEDLRIGNYIIQSAHINGGYITKTESFDSMNEFFNLYSPIPITEEWLIKLGAQQHESRKDMFNLFGYTLVITEDKDLLIVKGNLICEVRLTHLKYVHQLQNLIHSLTGSELTIKELSK